MERLLGLSQKDALEEALINVTNVFQLQLVDLSLDLDGLLKFDKVFLAVEELDCIVGVVIRITGGLSGLNHVLALELQESSLFLCEQEIGHQSQLSQVLNDVYHIQFLLKFLKTDMVHEMSSVNKRCLLLSRFEPGSTTENVMENLIVVIVQSLP